jgi:uncharacterized protein (DUF1501 family)
MHKSDCPSRRELLKMIAAAGLAGLSPLSVALDLDRNSSVKKPRVILFEMFGGNDNLNTLVPYKDPLYQEYRPSIGLTPKEYRPVSDDIAFNNALAPLFEAWDNGQMAVVQDVGSPQSVLSHFSAIELMDTASSTTHRNSVGWVADVLHRNPELSSAGGWDLEAVWSGGHIYSFVGHDVIPFKPSSGVFSKYLNKYKTVKAADNSSQLVKTIEGYRDLSSKIQSKLIEKSRFVERFHHYDRDESEVGNQCLDTLRLIESGVTSPVFKIGMSGFDIHANLRGMHEKRLGRAARYIAKLRQSLIDLDEWDNTLIVAYSEFGRRPKENASFGTDHGTASHMFFLGGRVDGGLKGQRSDLATLDLNGNVHFTTDYRRAFSTIVDRFWKASVNPLNEKGYAPLDGLIV